METTTRRRSWPALGGLLFTLTCEVLLLTSSEFGSDPLPVAKTYLIYSGLHILVEQRVRRVEKHKP